MNCYKLAMSSIFVFSSLCASVQAAEKIIEKKSPEIMHGTSESPPSRQYYCYSQQDYGNGSGGIKNAACKKSFEDAGDEDWKRARLFNNWNAYSQNLANSQTPTKPKDLVPDGKLCSAGLADYDSINDRNDAWHTTDMDIKEGRVQLTYIASQMHDPSKFRVFLTDQDHLQWDALKESPDVKWEQAPDSKNKSIVPGRYNLDVKLPDGYVSGNKAILFVMWERNEDPARETFFSCSDVIMNSRD
ncbi:MULTISPECIES: lytic polysaccharide monooxygenase auxiliary activity family 9 protein [unclassified Pseudomonas]|uniref:lytic polysaccharide monooxygenase auxiliary activity family 9 protein n=1 Tax=unclassified Pseudomonas TaxID=196821 RepID=UPI001199C5F2|nr:MULTISPECIES: lytic polysaccharide monooxygenase auxiliary activity family 9 protein [unclassified Pseudomonas]TWC10545.1 chitin-binding protein [Pseudomonas sp. SJZ075]TWC26700.1 chitin-binding protein [Pseudomonas sp. SJZ078]TWC45843.1 chitin-binding protein [Pseudomonas sp. SJZ124]TWC46106.1 chitin-binding protein [Pseudomonas sp. SJZ080]TWC81142.1 chitin-binding protein [Pseudomonas sp. SJZ101]